MNASVAFTASVWLAGFCGWTVVIVSGKADATGEALATLLFFFYTAGWMWWCYPEEVTPVEAEQPEVLERFVPILPMGVCEVCASNGKFATNEGHESVVVAKPCMHFSHKRCFDTHLAVHYAAAGEKEPCTATCPSCKEKLAGYTLYTLQVHARYEGVPGEDAT